MGTMSFGTYSATSALLTGVAGFLYAFAFVVLQNPLLSAAFLLLGGLFALPVFVALYGRLKPIDTRMAHWPSSSECSVPWEQPCTVATISPR